MLREQEKVLQSVDPKELVDLAIAMGNITTPSGHEQPMADFVLQWLRENGFERSYQQQLAEGRANTIGILKGRGGGRNLIFNSHMDSEQGMPLRLGQALLPGRGRGGTKTDESSARRCRTTGDPWRPS